eukprot:5228246-Amphidinium_carterae.2
MTPSVTTSSTSLALTPNWDRMHPPNTAERSVPIADSDVLQATIDVTLPQAAMVAHETHIL